MGIGDTFKQPASKIPGVAKMKAFNQRGHRDHGAAEPQAKLWPAQSTATARARQRGAHWLLFTWRPRSSLYEYYPEDCWPGGEGNHEQGCSCHLQDRQSESFWTRGALFKLVCLL